MMDEIGQLIEPDPIMFEFGAPGWYVVLGGLLILVVLVLVNMLIRMKRNRYRKVALEEIRALKDASTLVVNQLLKRICMSKYGRENVAALTGQQWIDFLNSKCKTQIFDESAVRALNDSYSGEIANTQGFIESSKNWIREHEF